MADIASLDPKVKLTDSAIDDDKPVTTALITKVAGNINALLDDRTSVGTTDFNSSGTFNVPVQMTQVSCLMVAGGGGGHGALAAAGSASGGGGGGGMIIEHIFTVDEGGTHTVTVGAGGTGGIAGGGSDGSSGSTTSFVGTDRTVGAEGGIGSTAQDLGGDNHAEDSITGMLRVGISGRRGADGTAAPGSGAGGAAFDPLVGYGAGGNGGATAGGNGGGGGGGSFGAGGAGGVGGSPSGSNGSTAAANTGGGGGGGGAGNGAGGVGGSGKLIVTVLA